MTTATKTEGYAIRYYSKKFIKEDTPKEMGYVKSPSIYPKPLAKAIADIIQSKSNEYKYHIFWVPNLETIENDIKKLELSYQEIDYSFLAQLPDIIGEIKDPVIGWVSIITGFYGHGSSFSDESTINSLNSQFPEIKHFLIDKSWT